MATIAAAGRKRWTPRRVGSAAVTTLQVSAAFAQPAFTLARADRLVRLATGPLCCPSFQQSRGGDPSREFYTRPEAMSELTGVASECTGASMYPTLSHTGSYILHSPLVLRYPSLFPSFTTPSRSPRGPPRLPARGSLITATSPLSPAHQVLKRVVGLPGDLVCVDPTGERGDELKGKMVRVPEGSIWLAGDNASNSTDSRDYGAVPLGMVKGSVVARVSFRMFGSELSALTAPHRSGQIPSGFIRR